MPRKLTGRRRGRPRLHHARSRETTRAGRRGEVDRGSERLREKKRQATSRDDVEMTPAGILFGRGHLDRYQYDALGFVTNLLHRVRTAMGGNQSVTGLWTAIIAAATKTAPGAPPIIGDHNARHILAQICRRLDGSRDLILALAAEGAWPDIVVRAANHRLTPRDLVQLELLRKGLDGIAPPRSWGFDEAL
jgi:hypothetical protein